MFFFATLSFSLSYWRLHVDEPVFNWQWGNNQSRKGKASRVDWIALWQAAKKGLSHSPYVTSFPNASAVCICQPTPAEGLSVLNCIRLTMPPFLFYTSHSLFLYSFPSDLLVSHVAGLMPDKREC